jgi:AcrR family transcriptional regulator
MGIPERKERDFRRRESDILCAALRLFDADDWQLVTIERIAQEAEIGKGTVYLHFPSKEDIYARLALDFSRGLLGRLTEIDRGLPALERMRQSIRVFFEGHRVGQEYRRLVEYCNREDFRRRISEGMRKEFQEFDADLTEVIHGILRQGIAEGVFPDKPLPVLVYGAQSALVGAVRIMWGGCLGDVDPERYSEEITRFVLAGLCYQDAPLAGGDREATA